MNEILYRSISAEELTLDLSEIAGRLKVPRDFDLSLADKYKAELKAVIDCKASAVKVPVAYEDDRITVGGMEIYSNSLRIALKESKEAFIFAVTLGAGVDRLLMKYSKTSPSSAFIADAVASAYAEAAADRTQEILETLAKTRVRFSPGYGDLPLELQPKVLETVNAQRLLGVTLTDSLLMKPLKTITAIAGIV